MNPGRSVTGLRIAIVNWRDPWHPEAGGAETYAWEMAQGLRRRGAAVTYVTARAEGQSPAEDRDGVRIVRRGSRFSVYPLALAWLLRRRRSFDAVIDCQNGIPFFTPWAVPRLVPVFCVVHHVHDAQFGMHFSPAMAAVGRVLEGPVARVVYRRHQAIAVSASTQRAMAERLSWKGPVTIIPNGLGPEAFQLPAKSAAEGSPIRPMQPATMTWVGRVVAHKQAERVLDVAARLGPAGHVIDVIGRGPCGAALADGVARQGLAGVVRLRGYLPEEAKRAAVAASALHLNTSIGEGWGLCVLEAAALGVPTVAYDVDGLRDAIRPGVTGWLAGSGERIEDVAERALKELDDPARRAEISAACRSWAAQFDWDVSAGQLADLIAGAVREKAGDRSEDCDIAGAGRARMLPLVAALIPFDWLSARPASKPVEDLIPQDVPMPWYEAPGRAPRVLLIGGTSEIGLAILAALDAPPDTQIVLAGRDEERLNAVAKELPYPATITTFDAHALATHPAVLDAVFADGPVDLLISAAGVLVPQPELDRDPLRAGLLVETNFTAHVTTILAAVGHMRRQGRGTVVVLSSVAAIRPRKANFVYGSAKAGLDAFARGLADAVHGTAVRVLLVRPGFVVGRMTAGMPPAPLSSTPAQVGAAVAAALDGTQAQVWVPRSLGLFAGVLRLVPRSVWRRLRR